MTKFTPEFQKELLKAFARDDLFARYFDSLSPDLFALQEHKIVYNAIKSYYTEYTELPVRVVLEQYLLEHFEIKPEMLEPVKMAVVNSYTTDYKPSKFLDEQVINFIQVHRTLDITDKHLEQIALNGKSEDVGFLVDELNQVALLRDKLNTASLDFLCRDFKFVDLSTSIGYPVKFESMNKCLTTKGFSKGQVIVFMASPKAGKTTLMINIATDYMKKGLKGLYVDTENGKPRLERMLYQNLLECNYDELKEGLLLKDHIARNINHYKADIDGLRQSWKEYGLYDAYLELKDKYYNDVNDVLKAIFDHATSAGGELNLLPLGSNKTVKDVEKHLLIAKELYNFTPDFVVCDYFDNMRSSAKSEQRRLNIQEVYLEWKDLAQRFGFFVFTPSQTNRSGFDKEDLSVQDIAEDFGKVAHADYVWAFVRTQEERDNNQGHIQILAARDGSDRCGAVYLSCDMDRCVIVERSQDNSSYNKIVGQRIN